MRKIFYLFIFVALISGCAMTDFYAKRQLSFVNYSKNTYPAHDKDYPIDLYFQDKPQKQYEVIGEIMGFVIHDNNLRPILETKARQVGADGVIDIQVSQGTRTDTDVTQQSVMDSNGNIVGTMPVAETSSQKVMNIKAKVFKYKQ
jgi:hypothetical protein